MRTSLKMVYRVIKSKTSQSVLKNLRPRGNNNNDHRGGTTNSFAPWPVASYAAHPFGFEQTGDEAESLTRFYHKPWYFGSATREARVLGRGPQPGYRGGRPTTQKRAPRPPTPREAPWRSPGTRVAPDKVGRATRCLCPPPREGPPKK